MTVHEQLRSDGSTSRPGVPAAAPAAAPEPVSAAAPAPAPASAFALAALRLATGVVFLWAFLDKTFGLGYATGSGKGWIDGGSPTAGFLGHVSVGPLQETFRGWAGATWADWLFMLGLLGVGLAVTAGVALRPAALAGAVMMALMWAAEWPPARQLADGAPSMSTNPLVDYHLIYALVLVVLAVASAGRVLGAGALWARLPLVRDHRWLR
ncbi:DoxX family membrane protein [Streptomyces sp. NPDC002734]|uniref:DoxX family membrane protein n=1 Tax=Streptomyces sp. NPDC002734 TaxID=3154426 RepID=UPI00331ECF41